MHNVVAIDFNYSMQIMMKLIAESTGKNLHQLPLGFLVVTAVVLGRLLPTMDMTRNCLIQGYGHMYPKVRCTTFVFVGCCLVFIGKLPGVGNHRVGQ